MKKQLIGVVTLATLGAVAFAGATQAVVCNNGVVLNGTSFNGVRLNGVVLNGVVLNGTSLNTASNVEVNSTVLENTDRPQLKVEGGQLIVVR